MDKINKQNQIELYQFRSSPKRPNTSPFCVKVELFLKAHQIPYKSRIGYPWKAPKGKLPYIEVTGQNSEVVCDSELIIQFLAKKYSLDLDRDFNHHPLTTEQRALNYSMRKTLDEFLIPIIAYARFVDPEGWKKMGPLLASGFPRPLKKVMPLYLRSKVRKGLIIHGLGRHSKDEIYKFAEEGLSELSRLLGNKPYLLGDSLNTVDGSAFGLLYNIYHDGLSIPYKRVAEPYQNLRDYTERIFKKYFDAK